MCQGRYATALILLSLFMSGSSFSLPGTRTVDANPVAFEVPIFSEEESEKAIPSKVKGVDIELPNFNEIFRRIRAVSPLACLALENENGGFDVADEKYESIFKWKKLESSKQRTVHCIEKIDNFQSLGCPVMRFRSSLKGPCSGMKFVQYIVNFNERAKWDPQIESVEEIYPSYDIDATNIAMDFQYGDCLMFGIGYTRTKPYLMVDGREQLTLCGLQQFSNGACIIWGKEMEERHDGLMPTDKTRRTRAKTHLFSVALVPTGNDSFDVEYVIQLECGGNLPTFLTSLILVDTVKAMFAAAKKDFSNKEDMACWKRTPSLEEIKNYIITDKYSILMTP